MSWAVRSQGNCSTSCRPTLQSGCFTSAQAWKKLSQRTSRRRGSFPANIQQTCVKVMAEPSYPELEKISKESGSAGSEKTMKVSFRDVDTFSLWLWFELYKPPNANDRDLLETVLESWFVVGRMGGFNSMNLQISQEAVGELNFFRYNSEDTETAVQAVFMDYGDLESQADWCRFWVNMGTADEVALDVLINSLAVFSKENLGIKQLIIGGVNPDWPVPDKEEQMLAGLGDLQAKQ